MRTGHLDVCIQSHCAGWAVDGEEGAVVEVVVDDAVVGTIRCDQERPDLPAAGLPRKAGFIFEFPRSLSDGSVVRVRFLDGLDIGNSPNTGVHDRLIRLLHGINPKQRGLELGALDRPIMAKDRFDIHYVDHATRDDLIRKYAATAGALLLPGRIVETDFVWCGGPLAAIAGTGFHYCVASHVIEHVADPLGWLGAIADVLAPGGRINLAIPEKTRTFDHRRALTQPAQLLDAWSRRLARPAFGQIFDHIAYACAVDAPAPPPLFQQALAVASVVERSGEYADVHCHVWTCQSFLDCWGVIAELGILPLALDASWPALPGANEFIVSLVKAPSGRTGPQIA